MAIINGTENNDQLLIDAGKSNDELLGLAGDDQLDGSTGAGNNILRGGTGNDRLYANKNDQLFGDAGNDELTSDGDGNNRLVGGDGNDRIYVDRNDVAIGDAGDDIIYAGSGGSSLTGGQGKDVFWIANGDVPTVVNTITDFDRFSDTIRVNLSGVNRFSDLVIAKSGETDATISFNGTQLALVKNTALTSLNSGTVVVNPAAPNNPGSTISTFDFSNLPELGTTSQGQKISLGGFSGLFFQGVAANGNLKFVANTDRGPNGDSNGANRPFALPNFQPELVQFELNQATGAIAITKRTGLFGFDGTTPLTGLPNLQAGDRGTAYTDEIGVDLQGNRLPNSPLGADLEGVVMDANGDYWMVDEYRPAIYHFNVNGKLLDRFIPQGTAAAPTPDRPAGTFGTEALPAVYAQRRNNRGFEAVAREGNKIYAFMQSAIDNPDTGNDASSKASRNLRILEFDIVTKRVTGEYLYVLEGLPGTDKIGDAVSLGNGKFAVIERDDNGTASSNKLIYNIDIRNATNINNPANFTLPSGKTIEQLTAAELLAANIKVVKKELILNAAQAGYTGVEKPEGLALVDANTLALLNDNDFGIRSTTNNPNGSVTLAIENVPSRLGLLHLSQPLAVGSALVPLSSNDGTGLIQLDGRGNIALSVKKVSRQTNARNEVGVFVVDDHKGTVNGFKPGDAGYIAEVLKRSQTIFAALDSGSINSLLDGQGVRNLNLSGNSSLGFYLIGNGTADEIRAGGSSTNLLFSFPSGNNGVQNAQVTQNNGVIQVAWEETKGGGDRDFNDLVIQIETATSPAPLGTNQQSRREIFDLTEIAAPVQVTFETKRDAAYNNHIGFYKVENVEGTIRVGNLLLNPDDEGYRKAAVDNRIAGIDLTAANGQTLTSNSTFQGGALYVPFLIADSGNANATYSNVYTAYSLGNADRADHIRLLANNTFGFEDLVGGGDRDFNDVIVTATFGSTPIPV
jgi:hypothetical protein